jgi:hypothetical protein
VSLTSITSHLRNRREKKKVNPSDKSNKRTQNTLSQVSNGIELIWWLGEDLIYWMCLGVESFALVLNVMFITLGWIWMRWLGVFIAPNHFYSRWWRLLAMGARDSPVRHRTVTVHCPVRATSAQPLGFGAGRPLEPLSSCCTGQSGALWLLTCTIHGGRWPLARRESLLRWLTGQSGGTPDSPVNYSGACLGILESGCFGVVRSGAPDSPVRHFSAHSSFLLSN